MRRTGIALLLLLGLGITPVLAAATKAAPTVVITSPAPGVTFATDQVEVTAVFTAPAGAAISQVELLVDGTVVQTAALDPAEESGEITLTWEASGYLDGKHQVVMRVTDTKGRVARTGMPTTLKRGMPDPDSPIRITSPARNTTISGVVDFRVDTDPSVKYVIFLVDNVFKAMSNLRPFSYSWDTSGYLNGLHRLQARAYLGDGSDVLSTAFAVRVDNPSGATTLKPVAPGPAVAPKPAAAPAHTTPSVLPPPQHTASATPYSPAVAVGRAEIGTPGTAPYVSPAGDLVTPPTTVLAERTPAGADLKVATVAEASQTTSAPAAGASASVSAPPPPSPTRIVATDAVASAPASTAAAASATSPSVAPVQVAALPTPASAPSRAGASEALPAPRTSQPTPPTEASSAPVAAQTAAATTPKPTPPTVTAATATTKPATVTMATAPTAAPKATAAAKPVTPLAPAKVVAAPTAPKTAQTVTAASPAKPVAAAVQTAKVISAPKAVTAAKPAVPVAPVRVAQAAPAPNPAAVAAPAKTAEPARPVTVALLPTPPATENPAPKLTAEPKAEPVASVIVNGEPLTPGYPTLMESDSEGQTCTLLPLRAVVEQLHGIVLWEHETKQATAEARGHRAVVTVREILARVNGKTVRLVVAPVIVEGRTLVPARFLAQAFDLALDYQDGVIQLAFK